MQKSLVDGILEKFLSSGGTMTHLIQSIGGRSHFGATFSKDHILIRNILKTTHCKMEPSQGRRNVLQNFL